MKHNIRNEEKVNLALAAANGKATTRTATFEDVQDYVAKIEKRLTALGLPKNLWQGLRFSVQPGAGKVPGCYYRKGIPNATSFELERGAKHWFLTNTSRDIMRGTRILIQTWYTQAQRDAIIDGARMF